MSSVTQASPTQAMAEAIRQHLGTDIVVLITPGQFTCAVIVASSQSRADSSPEQQQEPSERFAASADADRLAYSIAEAAKALGLSRDVLYKEIRTGRLKSLKVGRRRIITCEQIDHFLVRLARLAGPKPGPTAADEARQKSRLLRT
jgi:excisionase family DNA binding protein